MAYGLTSRRMVLGLLVVALSGSMACDPTSGIKIGVPSRCTGHPTRVNITIRDTVLLGDSAFFGVTASDDQLCSYGWGDEDVTLSSSDTSVLKVHWINNPPRNGYALAVGVGRATVRVAIVFLDWGAEGYVPVDVVEPD